LLIRSLLTRSLFLRPLLAGALVAAALAGMGTTVSTAAECLENPDQRVTEPGHWRYHLDRTLNRRCWHFEPEVAASAAAAGAPAATPAAADDAQQPSLLSRFAAGLSQTLSAPVQQPQLQQAQQSSIPDNTGETAQAVSPKKPARTVVRRERPQPAPQPVPQPTTTGAAERHDQAAAADKNAKSDPTLNVAEREALFQDFVKWQLERNVFGRP
jgi:hypothetical protein